MYPGVRCDIPAHVYQSTFSPNTQWSEKFAQGHEIRDYWQAVARKYDVYKLVKLNTTVKAVVWDDTQSKWVLEAFDSTSNAQHTYSFDFVLPALGRCERPSSHSHGVGTPWLAQAYC